MQIITPTDQQWDYFVRQQPRAHFLQLASWGRHKEAFGWQSERVAIVEKDIIIAGTQVLFRPLPFRLGTMAYLPMGPYIASTLPLLAMEREPGDEVTTQLWPAIHTCAKRHRAAFLKWEPGIDLSNPLRRGDLIGRPPYDQFKPSPQTIQPPRTILINISDDDETIMARMNQGTRRKVRQSYKSNIRYYHAARADVNKFTALMHTTGERNAFGVHEPRYYELAYDLFIEPGDGVLILAEHEGDILAGIMVFAVGDTAWYPYGASSNVKRNLMATYGVQWEAIQWAKSRGCTWYDFWGIPDEDEAALEAQFQERSDGLWGVYGFKRGWGGQIVRSPGAWDKVYNPLIYWAYKTALTVVER